MLDIARYAEERRGPSTEGRVHTPLRSAVCVGQVAIFLDKASRLYGQEASAVSVIIELEYGTDRYLIAFSASVFGLTGEGKRNLISVSR